MSLPDCLAAQLAQYFGPNATNASAAATLIYNQFAAIHNKFFEKTENQREREWERLGLNLLQFSIKSAIFNLQSVIFNLLQTLGVREGKKESFLTMIDLMMPKIHFIYFRNL